MSLPRVPKPVDLAVQGPATAAVPQEEPGGFEGRGDKGSLRCGDRLDSRAFPYQAASSGLGYQEHFEGKIAHLRHRSFGRRFLASRRYRRALIGRWRTVYRERRTDYPAG